MNPDFDFEDIVIAHAISQLFYVYPNYSFRFNTYKKINYDQFLNHSFDHWLKLLDHYFEKNLQLEQKIAIKKLSYKNFIVTTIFNHFNWIKQNNAGYLLFCDTRYPYSLKSIDNPPLALSFLGNIDLLEQIKVSVVGARKASNYAIDMAYCLGNSLAKMKHVVVSGGAIGCDISAHRGCLDSMIKPMPSIVVLPSGLDTMVPAAHQQTYEHIISAKGLIISERMVSQNARKYDYLIRNRIITGLSSKTIIVESSSRSGAMSSANLALEQGREVIVYAKTLEWGDIRAEGNAKLIELGANYFINLSDGLELVLS